MRLVVGLHVLHVLESFKLIILWHTIGMLDILFMIIRLILYSYYFVALSDHGVSLCDLCNYGLHLGPYRLFTSELILVQRHKSIAFILTLYDLLIILLVNL